MENLGSRKLTEELKRLNPNVCIYLNTDWYPAVIIARCSDCSKLSIPEGYEYNRKNGLTNKGHTTSGLYESFDLITEDEYL